MKNISTFLLTLLLLSSLNVQAQTTYTLTDDDVVVTNGVLASYSGSATAITIPPVLDGQTVTSIGLNAFKSKMLTSVTLPTTLTSIVTSAFQNNALTSVTLPEGITSIGSGCFRSNVLTSVTLPSSLTSIQGQAFENNQLTSLTLPEGITSIGRFAFVDNALTSVDFSASTSLTSIEENAFQNNALTSVDFSASTSLTSIGANAFQNNALTSVTLPATLTSMGDYAFQSNALTSVTLPEGITSIGNHVFQNNQLTSVTLPATLTSIGTFAFSGNALASLTLPATLTSIGGFAFSSNQLTSVTLPASLTSIGVNAFLANTNTGLTSIVLPATPGYTMTSWTGGKVPGDMITDFSIAYTRTATAIIYDITYELDGGANAMANPDTYTIETNTITLMAPTREEYTFGGWYSEATFDNPVTEIATGTIGNKTFHAKWLMTYTITYELDGGANDMDNPGTYTIETNTTLMAPTREEYTFGGWYSDEMLQNPVTEIATGTIGNKTFYAKWLKTYNITYVLDGGTNAMDNPDTYTIETNTITLMAPTRVGYAFDGWYSEATFDNPVTEIATGTTSDETFYARWLKTYNINYTLNGGTNPATNPTSYNVESTTITLMAATREGYTFGGWYSDEMFQNAVTEIATSTTGDKTFYAKWEMVLGLEDAHKDNTISIYPNPASDYFRLSQTSPERPQQMMLYDLSGHLVKQFSETSDNSYKVSGLLEGTYLLKIPAQDTTIRLLIVR